MSKFNHYISILDKDRIESERKVQEKIEEQIWELSFPKHKIRVK